MKIKNIFYLISAPIIAIVISLLISSLFFSWVEQSSSELGYLLFISLIVVYSLIFLFVIFNYIANFNLIVMLKYTVMYWFVHPLIVRPIKSISYIFNKQDKRVDYVKKITEDPTLLKNFELNNSKHRLNYLNFINRALLTNNKLLYKINLNIDVIDGSFPTEKLIIEKRYKVDKSELYGVEDSFDQRRKILHEEQVNFKYKKENRNSFLTVLTMCVLVLSLIGSISFIFINPIISLFMISILFASMLFLSIKEYKSILNTTRIIVNRKSMEKLKRNTLYDISNLEKLQDRMIGVFVSEYEQSSELIASSSKEDGIQSMYESFIEKFADEEMNAAIEKSKITKKNKDEILMSQQKERIDDEINKRRNDFIKRRNNE